MKVRTERKALLEALGWVSTALPKKAVVPATAGVQLRAEVGVLSARAFDFETAHTAAVVSDVITEGECLVPGLFFRDAIAGSRSDDVELTLDGSVLTISSGRSTYRARCLPMDDYPDLPAFPDVVGTVNPDRLQAAIAQVIATADDDHPNHRLKGLHLEGDADRLTLVATNGHRFHKTEVHWSGEKEFTLTVPGRTLVAAAKGMTEAVEVAVSSNLLGLYDGSRQWTTRRLDTNYADWQAALRQGSRNVDAELTVEGSDLLAAVKQVGGFIEGARPVILRLEGGELFLEAGSERGDACEVVAATGDADARLGVNPRYLADALSATSGGPLTLHFGRDNSAQPVLISDPTLPDLTLMVMPIRLGGTQ